MSIGAFQARNQGLVWSNSKADIKVWIRAALLRPIFHTLLDSALEFGLDRVRAEWELLLREAGDEVGRAAPETERILRHIAEGFADAQAAH